MIIISVISKDVAVISPKFTSRYSHEYEFQGNILSFIIYVYEDILKCTHKISLSFCRSGITSRNILYSTIIK